MPALNVGRPMSDEYGTFHASYVAEVLEIDPVAVMETQTAQTQALLARVSEEQSLFRYGPDKWSIREVVGHLADAERVFAYRALRIGRGDETPIEGFDENRYVANAYFDRRPLAELARELADVRKTSLALFRGLEPGMWNRRGIANNARVSVRALAYIIPGHERHHVRTLRERYGLEG
jgi:DinB superfamily